MSATDRDVIIIGAGASGMMCAIEAARRCRRVLLLDHSDTPGRKVRISGGGRCNFSNRVIKAENYQSQNPHFCKSALSRYSSADFVQWLEQNQIAIEERKHGQLFCRESAERIVALLKTEAEQAGAEFVLGCPIEKVERESSGSFTVSTRRETFRGQTLVIATGGLSYPQIGATGFGYEIARQFGLRVIEPAPALDGFAFDATMTAFFRELAGLTIDCNVWCDGRSWRENILFTHQGLSGPAALQASLYWQTGGDILIDLIPDHDFFEDVLLKKKAGNRSQIHNLLSEFLPVRFSAAFCARYFDSDLPLPQLSEKALRAFSERLKNWELTPTGTMGYDKAEVTRGGVDTAELSSKTLEARKVPGLFFTGEVVDVTGWLGGYNLQWAWSSGWAAGQVV